MKLRINLIKYFANLKFAINILILIASLSILGTIIEQEQTITFYKENYSQKLFNISIWKFIVQLGLDHIFQTGWFIFILGLFAASLSCCTFLQQFPILTRAQKYFFYRKKINYEKLDLNGQLRYTSNGNLITQLKIKKYIIYQQKNVFYAYKGLIGRIAPILVHISLLIILSGTLIASIGGFTSQELIPKTENFRTQNILNTNILTYLPKISARVNDFWIIYKKNGIVDQFYSDISIIDNFGTELKRKTISVNNPLKYANISYYQTDWNVLGVRIKIDNKTVYQVPYVSTKKFQKEIWFSWLPNSNGVSILVNNMRGINASYDQFGNFLSYLDVGEEYELNFHKFQIIEFIPITGLQIKLDPGITTIYFGFGLLMLSIFLSYRSFSQIWLNKEKNTIFVGGKTNRAQLSFEKEILDIILSLKNK